MKPKHPVPGPAPPTSVLGLGDAIKRVTTAVGIKPCKACQKRANGTARPSADGTYTSLVQDFGLTFTFRL